MMIWIKRLVFVAAVVIAAKLLWDERARLAPLSNNNFKVQGTWYRWEMDRKGFEPFLFTERIIIRDETEWGSYILRSNDEIEVTIGEEASTYHLEFPDEDSMVWSTMIDGDWVPSREWRR
jgi:hypothetical protein